MRYLPAILICVGDIYFGNNIEVDPNIVKKLSSED